MIVTPEGYLCVDLTLSTRRDDAYEFCLLSAAENVAAQIEGAWIIAEHSVYDLINVWFWEAEA